MNQKIAVVVPCYRVRESVNDVVAGAPAFAGMSAKTRYEDEKSSLWISRIIQSFPDFDVQDAPRPALGRLRRKGRSA